MKRNYKTSFKILSYIFLPVFIVLAILSSICIEVVTDNNELIESSSYYDTTMFSNLYSNSISENVRYCIENQKQIESGYPDTEYIYNYDDKQENVEISGANGTIYYRNYLEKKNFKFLIIDSQNHIAYTNVSHTMNTDNIEKIKKYIMENNIYWSIENNNISTSIEKLSLENIRYKASYTQLQDEYQCIIYTAVEDGLPYQDQYYEASLGYTIAKQYYEPAIIVLPISAILSILLMVVIIIGIGTSSEEVKLNWFDNMPLEIIGLFLSILAGMGSLFLLIAASTNIVIAIVGIGIAATIWYVAFILGLETFIKRLKKHTLIRNTLCYKVFNFFATKIKRMLKEVSLLVRLGIIIGIWLMINTFLTCIMGEGFFEFILLISFWIISFWYVFKKVSQFKEIYNIIKNIYEGNTKIEIDEENYKGMLRETAVYVKDIAGGFSNAIEESLKSERLKTELITNVSHDIKTPLTSIINYVDLLKKEEMPNEKSKQYLEILDNKSQRLKKLTEDLVEASKASSGNIKLNMEKINVKELLKQVSGEFEDKFKIRNLEEIVTLAQQELYINADSHYLYRVLENMYSNVSKYALENSRVYVDAMIKQDKVVIEIKNISKDKLNISVDELMQRFVRGDSSRNTEGSGLGLSIATSLTQLQDGKFEIYLDGDLFKVKLEFNAVE